MYYFSTQCLVSTPYSVQQGTKSLNYSNWWFCNESCRSNHGTRSTWRSHHLHQLGPFFATRLLTHIQCAQWWISTQISSPEGLSTFCSKFPALRVVSTFTAEDCLVLWELQITGWIDQGLNDKAYIIPGLGDFGERRYEPRPDSWASRWESLINFGSDIACETGICQSLVYSHLCRLLLVKSDLGGPL